MEVTARKGKVLVAQLRFFSLTSMPPLVQTVPMKQYIVYLNHDKPPDKKFIIADLDPTHLLVSMKCRDEVMKKVNEWMDENVFSSVEKVGEDLDMS